MDDKPTSSTTEASQPELPDTLDLEPMEQLALKHYFACRQLVETKQELARTQAQVANDAINRDHTVWAKGIADRLGRPVEDILNRYRADPGGQCLKLLPPEPTPPA
jgi:hypothetical protein